ncbi:hypothetical protein [Pedobacter sp.]|uniref:hypothetical protein n=1 Tax=Pedobacter sp. TaxID=1411316 RepID=UPI00396CF099
MKKLIKTLVFSLSICSVYAQTTQTRDNAGLRGDAGATSGFFETGNPTNYPINTPATWWHMLDVRHSNTTNNYAMQFASRFYNQELWFRTTNNLPSQTWSKVLLETNGHIPIGIENVDNDQGWHKVMQLHSQDEAKFLVTSGGGVKVGMFAHPLYNGKIGTESQHDLTLTAGYWNDVMTLKTNGNVGIGTLTPSEKLSVNGKIRAKEIKVETANWPDYVFSDNYLPKSLPEIEQFIKKNKHLPEVPSAQEAEQNGVELGEMNKILLKKIEELTLHLIEKDKAIQELYKRVERLEKNK